MGGAAPHPKPDARRQGNRPAPRQSGLVQRDPRLAEGRLRRRALLDARRRRGAPTPGDRLRRAADHRAQGACLARRGGGIPRRRARRAGCRRAACARRAPADRGHARGRCRLRVLHRRHHGRPARRRPHPRKHPRRHGAGERLAEDGTGRRRLVRVGLRLARRHLGPARRVGERRPDRRARADPRPRRGRAPRNAPSARRHGPVADTCGVRRDRGGSRPRTALCPDAAAGSLEWRQSRSRAHRVVPGGVRPHDPRRLPAGRKPRPRREHGRERGQGRIDRPSAPRQPGRCDRRGRVRVRARSRGRSRGSRPVAVSLPWVLERAVRDPGGEALGLVSDGRPRGHGRGRLPLAPWPFGCCRPRGHRPGPTGRPWPKGACASSPPRRRPARRRIGAAEQLQAESSLRRRCRRARRRRGTGASRAGGESGGGGPRAG